MCLAALATVYSLFLGITVVSTLKLNRMVVNMINILIFTTLTTISNQLTSLLGSALVTVALAPKAIFPFEASEKTPHAPLAQTWR